MVEDKTASLLAERLRHERVKRGLLQRELSHRCGIGENQIHKYETGISEPSLTNLKAIAQVLEVSVDYLLGLSNNPFGTSPNELGLDERQLLSAYAMGDSIAMMELMLARLKLLAQQANKEVEN